MVFDGRGNWSLDGGEINSNFPLTARVPVGSSVLKAYLYCGTALAGPASPGVGPTVRFDGVTYTGAQFDALKFVPFAGDPTRGMQAFRTDVTNQVAARVGNGSANPFTFPITNETYPLPGRTTGELLAVVYSNPGEKTRHLAIYDGGAVTSGDSFNVDLGGTIDSSVNGFEALFSLGIGFSTGTNPQFSQVDINGRRLSSSAGGSEDSNSLLTVGGVGDSAANPDPLALGGDDELYNLALGNAASSASFLSSGATSFDVATFNASGDDNIFFAGINVVTVPEPTVTAMAASVAGCRAIRRRRR